MCSCKSGVSQTTFHKALLLKKEHGFEIANETPASGKPFPVPFFWGTTSTISYSKFSLIKAIKRDINMHRFQSGASHKR
jgi:hypothetical protein